MKPLLADDVNHSRVMQLKAKLRHKSVNTTIGRLLDAYEGAA